MSSIFRRKNNSGASSNEGGFRESIIDEGQSKVLDVQERELRLNKENDKRQLWIQSRKYVLVALIFICGVLFFKYVVRSNDSSASEQTSIQKNSELEVIENKIIIGLDGERNKEELLTLVAQLNHTDADNFIDGKNQGIIASEIHGPDDSFFGTYAEYWTGLREGYKEIISQGITIEEYKNELRSRQSTIDEIN